MKERYLIYGSGGFLGKHLSRELTKQGHITIKGDRKGTPQEADFVFDLGSWGNLHGQDNPKKIFEANVMRLLNLLENESEFILTSSLAVKLPTETYYTVSKETIEGIARVQAKKGVRVCVVRPASVIGQGEQPQHLIPKLIDSCLNGTEMPFVAEPVHDYLDIEDFTNALLTVKDRGLFKGEVYEIGSGRQIRNEDIKDMVEQITGKKANLKYVESMRTYDTKEWKANIERIYSLGWKQKKSLQQSIEEMVNARKNTTN